MSEVQLEGSEGQLEGYEAQLEGTEGHLEGSKVQPRGDGRMDGRKITPFYRTSSPYQGRCPKIARARSHAVNFCMRVHFCVHVYFRICVSVRRLTFLLFQSLKIDRSFLAKDPSAWAEEVRYQGLSKFVKNLKVVNDVAEHAIQIVTNYAGKITKDEHH